MNSDYWYKFAKDIVQLYQVLFITPWVKGEEHIPEGPKIIVGNHSLASDPFILPLIFHDKLHFLIEHELFNVRFIGRLLELADQIPVVRGRGLEALRTASQKLVAGDSVVVFPEGRLNHGEQLYRAHSGAALLASRTGAPVLPVGFYTPPNFVHIFRSKLKDREAVGGWQFGGPLFVNIGNPLRLVQESSGYMALRAFTDQMMVAVTNLINEIRSSAPALPRGS